MPNTNLVIMDKNKGRTPIKSAVPQNVKRGN